MSGHQQCKSKVVAYGGLNFEVISMHKAQILYHVDVLMQGTKFALCWSCTVTHYSFCDCGGAEIWASGRLPEVKTIEKFKSPAFNVVEAIYERFEPQ